MISGKKKIKIEFEDNEGSKYNLSLDGDISKSKILKVYELMESLNIPAESSYDGNNTRKQGNDRVGNSLASVGSKIWHLLELKFPNSTFTSTDIQEMYEEEYKESMRLDAIATYLSRFVSKGKLVRDKKGGKEWVYKILRPEKPSPVNKIRNSSSYDQAKQYFDPKKQISSSESPVTSFTPTAKTYSSLTEVN